MDESLEYAVVRVEDGKAPRLWDAWFRDRNFAIDVWGLRIKEAVLGQEPYTFRLMTRHEWRQARKHAQGA